MKNILKSIFTLALAFIMTFTVFTTNTALTANAAEAGTLTSNAISLSNNQWYTKYWTYQNYSLNCYNKIVVPARGYITFIASKPFDDEGELCSYDFDLYSSTGKVIWSADAGAQKDSFNDYYTYKIGLNAGTYYMNIDPSFYVYKNSAPIKTQHKYVFTYANNWEIESNNDKATATQIAVNQTYYGVYTDESFGSSYIDFYKVYLYKGCRYRVSMGNYSELEAGTLIDGIYDPYDERIAGCNSFDAKESGNSKYFIFDAKQTGWYYYKLYNDGNDAGIEYTITISNEKIKASELTYKLSATSYSYNGKAKKPSVTVKFGSKKLKNGTDYTVTYASGRKKIGKYKVTIKLKGAYSGTKNLYFKINPPKTKIKKIKSSGNNIVVSFNKAKSITGYQVQISELGAKFEYKEYCKTFTVKSSKKTSLKFNKYKIDDGTTYFRIRTYKTVKGKKYYSKWSSVKKYYVEH